MQSIFMLDIEITSSNQNFLKHSIRELFNKELYSPSHWQGHRKLLKGKTSKKISMFPSLKNGFSLPCESTLENNYCYHLEFDLAVKEYRTQLLQLEIDDFLFTPDFFVLTKSNGIKIIEIKPESDLVHPKIALRLSKVKDFCYNQGLHFSIVTEGITNQQPLLNNYQYLYRASHLPFSELDKTLAQQLITEGSFTTIGTARAALKQQNLSELLIEHLICHNHLRIDFNKPVNSQSPLEYSYG